MNRIAIPGMLLLLSLSTPSASFAGRNNVTNSSVILTWRTLSETDDYGFEVQRKTAGESEYSTLPDGFVPGHGTSLQPQDPSFNEVFVVGGLSSCGLKQVDLDNAIHFAGAVFVDVVTGGVCLYRIHAGEVVQVRKCLLVGRHPAQPLTCV